MQAEELDIFGKYLQIATDKAVFFLPRIIGAGLVVWIGFKIIKKVLKMVGVALEKTGISKTLRPFVSSLVGVVLKGTALFIAASIVGADLTGLMAILAAVGFAVGMALQGSLGNFASGILILTLKPYKIDDWIQLEDKFGRVSEIGIFSTDIITPGNKVLIIPNSKITDSVVTNYSEKGMIRLELLVTMPYSESFPKVETIIIDALLELPGVLKDPIPDIGIQTFDTHTIQLLVRPFVNPDDYWPVTFEANKAIKNAFSKHGIQVAYSEGVEMGSIGD